MKALIRILVFGLAGAVLAGCVTSPPESQNQLPAIQNRVPDAWSQVVAPGVVEEDWVKDFGESQLVNLIETAFKQNPSLQAAIHRFEQAQASATISGAVRYPTLGAGLEGNQQKQLFNPFGSFEITNYNLSLSSQWEVDLWGKLRDEHSATLANMQAAGYDLGAVRLSLVSQVCKAYFNVKELLFQYRLAARTAESFGANLKVLESRYERGLVPAFDLRLSRSQAAISRSQVKFRESALDQAIRLLETLVGDYPGRRVEVTDDLPATVRPIPAGLPSSLLQNRPDLRAAERRLAALGARFSATRKNRLPDITLTGSYGQASSELDDLLDGTSNVWSIGGSIFAPLFLGGQLEAQRKLAEARFNEQLSNYETDILKAFREVETALANQAYLLDLAEELSIAAEQSAQALEQAWDLYERGLIDITAVLDAERRSFETNRERISALNQILQNRIDLYVALGGGFHFKEE